NAAPTIGLERLRPRTAGGPPLHIADRTRANHTVPARRQARARHALERDLVPVGSRRVVARPGRDLDRTLARLRAVPLRPHLDAREGPAARGGGGRELEPADPAAEALRLELLLE